MSTACPRHPGVSADYTCSRCRQPCCINCCYSMPDGSICCSSCYAQPESAAAASTASTASVSTFQAPATGTPARGCPQHPLLPPVAFCKMCGKGSCVTCDFFFPPNLHLCPVCVTTAHSNLTPQRKKYMITAFCMAAVASFGVLASLGGMAASAGKESAEILAGALMVFFIMIPAAIGTGIAWAAFKPGGPNPISVWIATIWNALLLGAMIVLIVIGNLMG